MRLSIRLALATALVVASTPALADAIDGEWCHAGKSLHIAGPRIRTPGSSEILGNYSRHDFVYVVPAAEPEAGSEIVMRLLSEEEMTLAGKSRLPETWRRCKVTS